jgi:hypothetical protein
MDTEESVSPQNSRNTSLILLIVCLLSAAAYFIWSDEVRYFLEKLVRRAAP